LFPEGEVSATFGVSRGVWGKLIRGVSSAITYWPDTPTVSMEVVSPTHSPQSAHLPGVSG